MKLLIVNGSPRIGSSTEILAHQFELGFRSVHPEGEVVSARLNDLDIIPCQACGINPSPDICIYHDDLYPVLRHLAEADLVLVATPVYFDSVSAQTKLFVDRTNCFRPPIIRQGKKIEFDKSHMLKSKGAFILVGGDREEFRLAERVIGGMFVWCGIEKIGGLTYVPPTDDLGSAENDASIMAEAFELGRKCSLVS